MHHLVKSAEVMWLSYALATVSVVVLQAVPVPVAVPPSVRSTGVAQTLAVPPPPQVCGDTQLPHEAVRATPQLSLAVTAPQFLASRVQKALSLSAVQLAGSPNICTSAIWNRVLPLLAVKRTRYCW